MYDGIIVAVDASAIDKAERIVPRAVKLLRGGGRIVLVSVAEELPGYIMTEVPVGIAIDARRETEARVTDLRQRLVPTADIEIRTGAPAQELLSAVEEHKADLIILASHKPDFSNYFFGATADRVVPHARCSVLVNR